MKIYPKKTFYIIRHGHTFATFNKTAYGETILTAGIIPEAKAGIEKLAAYLQPIASDFQATSTIPRCRETAAIITSITGKQFVLDKRLNEFDTSPNLYITESFGAFETRLKDFLSFVEEKRYQNIIICTHGAGVAALKHLIFRKELAEHNLLDYPAPGALTIVTEDAVKEIDFTI